MIFYKSQFKQLSFPTKLLTLCIGLLYLGDNNATSYDELAKIESACQRSSSQCLLLLNDALTSSTTKSRQWYRLKLLQLDAFFTLQQLEELSSELETLLTYDTLPVNFSIYVYIYHAKLLYGTKDISAAKEFLTKAVSLLTQLNDKYPKPMRLIEIANLQTSLKDYEQAKETLLQLELKFESRYHPVFKRELYANLGHVAYRQDDKVMHLKYREKSLNWALKANNNQQVGIAHNNFAWAYQQAGSYKEAEQHYNQAIEFAQKEQDDVNGSISQLRLVDVVLLQGDIDRATLLFKQLPVKSAGYYDSKRHSELYQNLKLKLKE